MRVAKSAVTAWAVGVSVAAVIGLGGPVWAESTTRQPTTQQPAKPGPVKGAPKAPAGDKGNGWAVDQDLGQPDMFGRKGSPKSAR